MKKLVLNDSNIMARSEKLIRVAGVMQVNEYLELIENDIIDAEKMGNNNYVNEQEDGEKQEVTGVVIHLFIDNENEYNITEDNKQLIIESNIITILDGKNKTEMLQGLKRRGKLKEDSSIMLMVNIMSKADAESLING